MTYRGRLLALAKQRLNPILLRRVTPEEIVQDTLSAACQKANFLEERPDVPVYFKLRTLLLQTLTDVERKHLQSQKRDVYKEVSLMTQDWTGQPLALPDAFIDAATGPLTKASRQDRYELLRRALDDLPENDRQILELRHFDDLSNADCAEVLHLTPKNASIRYVRALERLQRALSALTEFRA